MKMKTFEFIRWTGAKTIIKATSIEFICGGGIAFYNECVLVLAVKHGDWNNLKDISEMSND